MRKAALSLACALACISPAFAADQTLVTPYARPDHGGAPFTAVQTQKLQKNVDAILARPGLRGGHIGLVLQGADSGQVLYRRNADDEFMPASNFKLLTGSTALHVLGPAFTYTTTVQTDGTNLYLRGGGDALLRAKDLDDAAAAVAAAGITHVPGSIVADAGYFDDQRYGFGWSWDDFPYYYAAPVSALGLEDNVLHVFMSPGQNVGDPVRLRIEPQQDSLTIVNRMTTGPKGSKDTSDIVRSFDDFNTITLTGTYPLGEKESGDLVPAVPSPPKYAASVFSRALAAHGVTAGGAIQIGATPAAARTVWTHQSEPMPQLLEDFWWPSDNLMGEMFLKELGVHAKGTPGTDEAGISEEQAFLKAAGIDPKTVSISDGSGLSQYDRITPTDLVKILLFDWRSPQRDTVLDALPLSGVRGSLRSSFKNTSAEKNVFAKTGSISHVRTISGFLRTKHHGTVAFSFMLDDWMEDPAALAKIRGDLFSLVIDS
jgi:D-alanyl-D-alanine carboxypeptidase/D-alanyl-D-alanine-endopeptidase (penicillin-binding protein 4)